MYPQTNMHLQFALADPLLCLPPTAAADLAVSLTAISAMAMDSRLVSLRILAAFLLIFAIFMPAVRGQGGGGDGLAPAPTPTSDGTAIDQGIAYVLMLLALVLTYLIHTFDAPLSC